MALQTGKLVLAGLGVLGDVPPDPILPTLVDGIHLRWAFQRDLGFPWHGFFLFRRSHRKGDPICPVQRLFSSMKVGEWTSAELISPVGTLSSDRNLRFTDDFPVYSVAELDLDQRAYSRYILPPQEIAHQVNVTIGFRSRGRVKQECVRFASNRERELSNPYEEGNFKFLVYKTEEMPAKHITIARVQTPSGIWGGLDCETLLEVGLVREAPRVNMLVSSAVLDKAKIEAFNTDGSSAKVVLEPYPKDDLKSKLWVIRVEGKAVSRIFLRTYARPHTLFLHIICAYFGEDSTNINLELKAFFQQGLVAQTTISGTSGQIVYASIEADAITSIELSAAPAALIEVCYVPAHQSATSGWEPLKKFSYPMTLPVSHPTYPCHPLPPNEGAARNLALSRITYGLTSPWQASFPELHKTLLELVQGGPATTPMVDRVFPPLSGVPSTPDSSAPPQLTGQRLLELVLMASLNPAVAQMVGLFFVDQTAKPGVAYDYLIVADYVGAGGKSAQSMLDELNTNGFSRVEGYIVFNRVVAPASPLSAPENVRSYALPGSTFSAPGGQLIEGTNNSGLRWDLGSAVMYHVWRADLGNHAAPDAGANFHLLTKSGPVLVVDSNIPFGIYPERASDWPPFPLHFIDRALKEGWYGYKVGGIDLFGRHSVPSDSADWFEWAPAPDPRPWYYIDPPSDQVVYASAIRLLDKVPPPPPTAVEAYALDPNDPFVVKDAAYQAWWSSLSAGERLSVTGLRVSWNWTFQQMRQAPDAKEFRVYFQPGRINVLTGEITSSSAVTSTESLVTTNIAHSASVDDFKGGALRTGSVSFRILKSLATNPLQLRVENLGLTYTTGTVSVVEGSAQVTGSGTTWHAGMIGLQFELASPLGVYSIFSVESNTQITLNKIFSGSTATGQNYTIFDLRPPSFGPVSITVPVSSSLYKSYRTASDWQERFYVVGFNDNVTVTTDGAGQPLRRYETFLPGLEDSVRTGVPLITSLAEPVSYAQVGVSTSDGKIHTPDDPKWAAGGFGNRPGNEGDVGPIVTVFRVRRELPPAPVPPPDSERVYASPADYQRRSFYTYRWKPQAYLRASIFRALDESIFRIDWEQQPRSNLLSSQLQFFPDENVEPRWNLLKRQQIAEEINQLNSFSHDAAGALQALEFYRGLSNDALRVLGGLSGNEKAFVMLTPEALDPNDPANQDRRGPDSPSDYTPSATLRAYQDTLDGRSSNRYFYRTSYVDKASNQGPLSLSSPPVWLYKVTGPRAPVMTKVLGGDRQVTVFWTSNREADLAAYRLYRTQDQSATRDIGLMTLIHTHLVSAGDPNARPIEVSFIDTPVQGLVTYFYRLVAEDQIGNFSAASLVVSGRAYDESFPTVPILEVEWVTLAGGTKAQLSWTSSDDTLVQRRDPGGIWVEIASWRPPGNYEIRDPFSDSSHSYEYRLWCRKYTGAISKGNAVALAAVI